MKFPLSFECGNFRANLLHGCPNVRFPPNADIAEVPPRVTVWSTREATVRLSMVIHPQTVMIPPGTFSMGSPPSEERSRRYDGREEPRHDVQIRYSIAVAKCAVSVDDFAAFITDTAHDMGREALCRTSSDWNILPGKGWRDPDYFQTGQHPVTCVSWFDARAYLGWINDKLGLSDKPDRFRLLTEAEWEYACRSGTTTAFNVGPRMSSKLANYDGTHVSALSETGEYRQGTTPVGTFPGNAFGLHDMHGNVWEWCEDVWHPTYDGAPNDGSAWTDGGDQGLHILRGGSWDNDPEYLRSARRVRNRPIVRASDMGFRIARTVASF